MIITVIFEIQLRETEESLEEEACPEKREAEALSVEEERKELEAEMDYQVIF